MKTILIDDEYDSCEILQYELQKIDTSIEIIGMFDKPMEAVRAIRLEKPDVLFLDIEMPKLNGFEVLDLLGEIQGMQVVFVTAYNEYALRAFRYYAIDYLLKPVDPSVLKDTVDKLRTIQREVSSSEIKKISSLINDRINFSEKIVIPISNGYEILNVQDIIRCEADNNYTTVITQDGKNTLVSKPLKHFEETLNPNGFLRIHQSHLINPNHIKKYIKSDGGYLVMNDDSIVSVARSMKKDINELFKKLVK